MTGRSARSFRANQETPIELAGPGKQCTHCYKVNHSSFALEQWFVKKTGLP